MSVDIETAPKLLVSARTAAEEILSISERKLWSLTSPRGPIPCVRIGKSVRYSVAALEAWVEQQTAVEA
jgi:predicted DNA-binding transcriptional regulator AlpA